MPLTKPKGAVENFKQKKHSHTCTKCGQVWNCSLQIDPQDRRDWANRKPEPINLDKAEQECWYDNDPDCVKCEVAA